MPAELFGEWLDRNGIDMSLSTAVKDTVEEDAWNEVLVSTAEGDETAAQEALEKLRSIEENTVVN